MTPREQQLKAALPPLMPEQVDALVAYMRGCDYAKRIDWDNQCCASEAVDDAVSALCDKLREAYGAVLAPMHGDEDDDE